MYLPTHFNEIDPSEITTLLERNPLGCLVAQTEQGLCANHIPMLRAPSGALIGHIARANDLHALLAPKAEVMVIFKGEESYISPNLYPSKQDHHRHVPTWNYQVAHLYGRISFQHDTHRKRAVVGQLTKVHEARVNGAARWKMSDAPEDYMGQMLDAIVAFEIEVTRVIAKSKISQNREPRDFEAVKQHMQQTSRDMLAQRMERLPR
jgi:transcriptional regulator